MNWNLLGHEWAVDLLRRHVAGGRHRHAYLFTGPRGVGRRTLAMRFAQALNCTQPASPGEPCLECRNCQQLERMQHPDLAVVQAEQIGATLKVEQVRELQRSLALTPYQARYRIALLLRFEEAHASAANALLKTLEEPPPQVVLLLTAESAERLPPTIVSRCELLRLRPVPVDAVAAGLQDRWGLNSSDALQYAHLSGGRPGYALHLHQDQDAQLERKHWLAEHTRLLASSHVERFEFAEKAAKDKERLGRTLEIWLSLWRDVFLHASGASAPLVNLDAIDQITALSALCGLDTARGMVAALQRTLDMLERNVNTRLALEVLFLDLPKVTA